MEEEKNEVVCENQQLNKVLADMKDELCQLKRVNCQLEDDLDITNRQVKILQNENCKLTNCITIKNEEIRELQKVFQEIDRLKIYICRLEKEKACYEKTIEKAEHQQRELERCLHEKDCCLKRLEHKIHDLHEEMTAMENNICRLEHDNNCLRQEFEECQDALRKSDCEMDALCQKLKCMEGIRQKLQEHVKQLQTGLCQMEKALEQEKCLSKKLNQRMCDCQNDNQRLKTENICLEEQNEEMNKKIQTCCKLLNKTRHDLECVKNEFECYRQNIGELKDQLASGQLGRCSKTRKATRCSSEGGEGCISESMNNMMPRTKRAKSRFSTCSTNRR
ncbi:hypothetical protein WDU94_010993 [Cyamophila willieti]